IVRHTPTVQSTATAAPTAPSGPRPTDPTAPSPTAPTGPSPTAPTAPSTTAPTVPAGSVTSVAQSLKGAIGSQYIAGQDKLYFVEFIGSLSFLDNLSSGSPVPHVLGTGYTEPEDVYVTSDGSTAYITERSGDLVQVNLSNPNRDRDQAKVIASGLTAPQQIVVDEAGGSAYT